MRRILMMTSALMVAVLVLGACGDDDDSDNGSDASDTAETTAPETTAAPEGPSAELCAAIDELDASLDAIDGDSPGEFQAAFATAQQDFAAVKAAAGDEYAEELAAFEAAMGDFQATLGSFTDGEGISGLIEGIGELATAAAELGAAGEALDEQIDC